MTYELCLEYGTYPLRPVDVWADEINTAPAFITEDKKLLELLEEVNTLFHELFLTIECSFHYIGHDFPAKRAKITQIYHVIIEHLSIHYPEYDIKIESLLMG
ncbi:TPA: hypothetical protein ACJRUO_000843 [Streptococcus agalactiae]